MYQKGAVFDAAVLDITDDVLMAKFATAVANVAAFSRKIGMPTAASLPHMMSGGFKNIAALVSDIEFSFKEVEQVKAFLAYPSAFAVAAAPTAAAAGSGPAAVAAPVVEEEEEEEEDMDFDLFG